jgi:hypothetical protein
LASRRRVKITNKPAPRISAGVERGVARRQAINPNQVQEDQSAIQAGRARVWATGNKEGTTRGYPGVIPGRASTLPNSENIPNNRYFGDPYIEATEADLFSQSDNASGDFIPLTYAPTKTAFPGNGWDHRRTIAAGYSKSQGILRVQFYTDGSIYDYGTEHPIPPAVAKSFRMAPSPGRFINTTLESFGYLRIS